MAPSYSLLVIRISAVGLAATTRISVAEISSEYMPAIPRDIMCYRLLNEILTLFRARAQATMPQLAEGGNLTREDVRGSGKRIENSSSSEKQRRRHQNE